MGEISQKAFQPRLVGVIHLPPLPGSPRWDAAAGMAAAVDRALADAQAYQEGGACALCLENFGDTPFFPDRTPPETVAAMAFVAAEIRRSVALPIGFNVLRCDPRSALALAAVAGGEFIRVNVHTGASVTDQGLLQGRAHETLRDRQWLAPGVRIWADVDVKHAAPLAARPLGEVARETWERGLADGLIVSGQATGSAVDPKDVRAVRQACPGARIYLGSGSDPKTLPGLLPYVDGAIVGTWVKRDGRLEQPVDADRVRRLVALLAG